MAEIPQWFARGDWFDVCSCDIPCPCEFAQPPTNNHCEGVLAYHIREGRYGEVPLDGLSVIMLGMFDGNIWTGEARLTTGFFIDESADEAQREALQTIFSGRAGGHPEGFARLVEENRGIEFVPIRFEVADDLANWSAAIPGRIAASADALTGPTTPPGERVQTINPPGNEVGIGGVATWGKATANRVEALGFQWEWSGQSSKHIPFDWAGPS